MVLLIRNHAFAVLIGLSLACGGPVDAAISGEADLTSAQWREDLAFMVSEMEARHPNLYHTVDRSQFQAAASDLRKAIPDLQRNAIIVGLMRLAAMIGDGHTRVDPRKDAQFRFASLPLKLYLFEDGLFIRAAEPRHADLVGARIDTIGGVPTDEALQRVAAIVSQDNVMGARLMAPIYLNMPDILHALGLSETRDGASLGLSRDGRQWRAEVPVGAVEPLWPADTDVSLVTPPGWIDARTAQPPLWLEAPLEHHRLVDLPEPNVLYAQINMVTDTPAQSLAAFGSRIAERARAGNPRAVVLDLRLAQGGNHDLRFGFVREMVRVEDGDTRLFVLTGRGAFSASEFVLVDLRRLTDAVFLGEPASSRPNSYSDAYRTPLPNSGISIRTSIAWNQSDRSEAPWTPVDIAVPLTFADYVAGRDKVLDAALSYRPEPDLPERLLAVAVAKPEAVPTLAEAYLSDARRRYADQEALLAQSTVALVRAGHAASALNVARMSADRFPARATAFNLLAQIAERAGERTTALAAGRRALELDRNDRQMRALVERLSDAE